MLAKREKEARSDKIFANGLGTSRIPASSGSGCVLRERNLTRDEETRRGKVEDKRQVLIGRGGGPAPRWLVLGELSSVCAFLSAGRATGPTDLDLSCAHA